MAVQWHIIKSYYNLSEAEMEALFDGYKDSKLSK